MNNSPEKRVLIVGDHSGLSSRFRGLLDTDAGHPRRPHLNVGVIGHHDPILMSAILGLGSAFPDRPRAPEPMVLTLDSMSECPPLDLSPDQFNRPLPRPRIGEVYTPKTHASPNAARHSAEKLAAAQAKRERRAARRVGASST